MTFKEVYEIVGGDCDDVVKRLVSEEFATRFVLRFLTDDSFSMLAAAYAARDVEKAFGAAHMLKGVAQNLGFGNLGKSAAELTEILRRKTFDGTDELFAEVKSDYLQLISVLTKFAADCN